MTQSQSGWAEGGAEGGVGGGPSAEMGEGVVSEGKGELDGAGQPRLRSRHVPTQSRHSQIRARQEGSLLYLSVSVHAPIAPDP